MANMKRDGERFMNTFAKMNSENDLFREEIVEPGLYNITSKRRISSILNKVQMALKLRSIPLLNSLSRKKKSLE